MISEFKDMWILVGKDIELHESRVFGLCGDSVDGSVETVFRSILFVCGLARNFFLQCKVTYLKLDSLWCYLWK